LPEARPDLALEVRGVRRVDPAGELERDAREAAASIARCVPFSGA